jgi:hypothetical protein
LGDKYGRLMEERMRFWGGLRSVKVLASKSTVHATISLAATLALAIPAAAQLFTAEQEACFGRVYDRAHLASHPSQKVTSLHVFRPVGDRPQAENWKPSRRDEAIKQFRENGQAQVEAFVTFRDRKGYFHNWLTCNKETNAGARCYIECDGGSFDLRRESAGTVLLNNGGFVLVGGCGEDVEATEEVYFSPGQDDKMFRLEPKAAAVCRAEQQKARPIREGKPLRERFQEAETFCFGRDYDAAHLASHPNQKVAAIRVGRLDPAGEHREPDETWPENAKLKVAVTLKATARRALNYICNPKEASWECVAEMAADARSTCDGNFIHLARGTGDEILLINRGAGLPIDAACRAKAESEPNDDHQTPTRSDDKTFRLVRMPIEACR